MARLLVLLAVVCSASAFHVAAPVHGAVSSCRAPALDLAPASPRVARASEIVMAVPKKRQSKMKTRQRKANWFAKAKRQASLAWNRGMSAKYDPLEDPKYSLSRDDVDDDDDDDDDDEE